MVCCDKDMQFLALVCRGEGLENFKDKGVGEDPRHREEGEVRRLSGRRPCAVRQQHRRHHQARQRDGVLLDNKIVLSKKKMTFCTHRTSSFSSCSVYNMMRLASGVPQRDHGVQHLIAVIPPKGGVCSAVTCCPGRKPRSSMRRAFRGREVQRGYAGRFRQEAAAPTYTSCVISPLRPSLCRRSLQG